ncbi:hypothetical protein RvY_03749 [Ramazzottius varieornatus]|uniref:Uncharacterized protein n=1 Tax=Ramazzottius varieornatus TaxID=947166 RepID=A0A1D1USL7_RAMVA|nr:hypothetical protein RvY_03749 [Ramazzottius varieornatus]
MLRKHRSQELLHLSSFFLETSGKNQVLCLLADEALQNYESVDHMRLYSSFRVELLPNGSHTSKDLVLASFSPRFRTVTMFGVCCLPPKYISQTNDFPGFRFSA